MPCCTKVIGPWLLIVVLAGCTQKIYFRHFQDEEMPNLKKNTAAYWVFTNYTIRPVVDVSSNSSEPILDTTFDVVFHVLPTDSSKIGNARFVESFALSPVVILDTDSWDTVAVCETSPVSLEDWRSYNLKTFDYGEVPIAGTVERITLKLEASLMDGSGNLVRQQMEFRMYRRDGYTRGVPGWLLH